MKLQRYITLDLSEIPRLAKNELYATVRYKYDSLVDCFGGLCPFGRGDEESDCAECWAGKEHSVAEVFFFMSPRQKTVK